MYIIEYLENGRWQTYRKIDARKQGIHQVLALLHRKIVNTGYAWRLTTPNA